MGGTASCVPLTVIYTINNLNPKARGDVVMEWTRGDGGRVVADLCYDQLVTHCSDLRYKGQIQKRSQ